MASLLRGIYDFFFGLAKFIVRNPKKKTQRAVLFYFFCFVTLIVFLLLEACVLLFSVSMSTSVGIIVGLVLCYAGGAFLTIFVFGFLLYVPIVIHGESAWKYLDGLDDEHMP